MKYEIRNIEYRFSFTRINATSGTQLIVITTGIVGEVNGFTRYDELMVTLTTGLTIDANEQAVEAAAQAFVTNKYPNT